MNGDVVLVMVVGIGEERGEVHGIVVEDIAAVEEGDGSGGHGGEDGGDEEEGEERMGRGNWRMEAVIIKGRSQLIVGTIYHLWLIGMDAKSTSCSSSTTTWTSHQSQRAQRTTRSLSCTMIFAYTGHLPAFKTAWGPPPLSQCPARHLRPCQRSLHQTSTSRAHSTPSWAHSVLSRRKSFLFLPCPDTGTISHRPCSAERVQKRASNVLKLTQENEKLKEELRAMTARLEAAERRRQEIANRQLQQTQQPAPSST